MAVKSVHIFPDKKRLTAKIQSLQSRQYLPEPLVQVVGLVSLLQHEAAESTCFGADGRNLPATLQEQLASSEAHFQGASLLPREFFPLDKEGANSLGAAIIKGVADVVPTLAPHAKSLAHLLEKNGDFFTEACIAVIQDNAEFFSPWEEEHSEAPGFFRFVAQSSVMPSAMLTAQLLASHHSGKATWTHGHCPLCGSQPLMGQLATAEGMRLHTCAFCFFEYRVPRIGCPFCLNASPDNSEYYMAEEEPGYQIEVCNSCKSYIKLADFRTLDRQYIPVLDDLESLTLDLHARRMGYTRLTLSAWGF